MPLSPMDPNTQETESAGRKRSHIEFSADLDKAETDADMKAAAPVLPPVSQDGAASPLDGSPMPTSHAPQTPSESVPPQEAQDDTRSATSASKPVAKRKRLTPQEKEARDKDLAEKKREREAQAANRAAEKAKQDEEKAARAKERDEKRKKKEEDDRAKAEKKRRREEEQQRVQAEKDRKARSQTKLISFLVPSTPMKTAAESSSNSGSPSKTDSAPPQSKPQPSVYEQLFKPFFVKTDTRWTDSIMQMDPEAREAKAQLLDDFISGRRELEDTQTSFDAEKLLSLPYKMPKRGRLHHPVMHIMETACKEAEKLESAGLVVSDNAFEDARRVLAKVPMKVIAFSQDVRPPYYGTVTMTPFALGQGNMYRQARKSSHRRLPLDYDYDSEAEWQDDEGEDVDIDDDDDEQEDEDDMEGFLDDSEDAGLARRVFANTMEPESSGIRFEDKPGGSDGMLDEYKMEFMHDGTWGIDPWSARYWEPEPKKVKSEEGAKMAPPPAPVNGFESIRNVAEAEPVKLVKTELWDDMKRVILDNKALTKGSIIDIIFQQFRDNSVSRAEVKNTVELLAEKKGLGRSKEWNLKPKYNIEL